MNNREIKFRVWDKRHEHFINRGFAMSWDGPIYNLNSYFKDKNFIIQQFTGLKDKTGREIYEGDIIYSEIEKVSERDEFEDFTEKTKKIVIFNKGIFGSEKYGGIEPLLNYLDDSKIKKYEIIGNIFENKDLLE